MYTNMLQWITEQSPLFLCFPFLHSHLLPIRLPLLTWNPPCCDRIRPPRSQVACKLIFPFPSPCSYTPHSEIPTPWGFPDPNIHSLGRHRESGSQDPAQYLCTPVLYIHELVYPCTCPPVHVALSPFNQLYVCGHMYRRVSVSTFVNPSIFVYVHLCAHVLVFMHHTSTFPAASRFSFFYTMLVFNIAVAVLPPRCK